MSSGGGLPPALLAWLGENAANKLKYADYVWYFIGSSLGALILLRASKLIIDRFDDGVGSFKKLLGLWHKYVTYPIIPFLGFKIGELLIILVYFSVIISFCFAETSTSPPPLSIIGFSSRSGKIAIATTPFTILLSGRNNIVSLLLGIPYEKLRIYHFWIGRITLLCALLHVCGKLKTADGTTFEVEANRYGLLAFISLCVLFVGSLSWIMKWCYEVFWVIHFVTIAVFIAGAYKHKEMNHDYLIAAIAIWAFDRFVRFLRVFAFNGLWRAVVPSSRTSLSLPVKIQKVSSDTLRVELTKTDFPNWSPGSHAFLTEVGGVHWFPQGHPFSIASIPTSPSRAMPLKPPQIQVDRSANPQANSTADQNEYNLSPFRTQENVNQSQDFEMMSRSQSSSISKSGFNSYNGSSNGNSNLTSQLESHQQSEVRGEDSSSSKTLVFIIRVRSGWTKHLAKFAGSEISTHKLNFLVDGPYSGISSFHNSYKSILLVAGGSGVSWTLPFLCDMVRKSHDRVTMKLQKLTWIWIIREEDHLNWIQPELSSILDLLSKTASSTTFSIQIFMTSPTASDYSSGPFFDRLRSCSNVEMNNGRPNFDFVLSAHYGSVKDLESNGKSVDQQFNDKSSLVACSGPTSMSEMLREKVREGINGKYGQAEFKSEDFGW